jgi:hypothetical protein
MANKTPPVVFGEHKKLHLLTEGGVFNGELQGFLDKNSGLNEQVEIIPRRACFRRVCVINLSRFLTQSAQSGKLFVVSIIGLQSSGKSTLLNNLFHTDLRFGFMFLFVPKAELRGAFTH